MPPIGPISQLTRKVLVLGDGVGAFLSVVRSLGRAGLHVHVGWCSDDSPAARSRFVERIHAIPRPAGSTKWLSPLIDILTRENFDLVIATNEQSIRPLHLQQQHLAHLSQFNFIPDDVFSVVFDKQRSTALAASLNLNVPRSLIATSIENIYEAAGNWGYPLVVKPLSSYDDDDLSARQNVVKLQNRTMVERFADKFQHGRALLVQEHFWGIGVGVEVLCDAGEILFAFQHERVHQPRHGGASSYRKSVPINLELLDAARRIAAELKFTGAMMLEFLYNKQSQEWRFVEINPRFWGSLPLAVAAGANFPLFLYDLLVNQRRDFPQNYQKNVYCRNLVGDLKWCLQNLIYGPRNTTTPTPGRLSMAYEARHALLGREYSDTFALDDMRPGWAELWKYFKRAADNSTAIANRWVLERRLFRHRLHAQAVLKFRSARSINFVCYGNICRSAFAEMYLRKHDGNRRRIASSGIQADDARKSPVTAIIAAEEWDICLADHSATRTHCDSLSESDLIVTFDETIHLRLRRLYPHLSDRMLRFGALATTGDLDIPDPYGKSLEHFRDVYRNIATTLDSILTSTNPASQLLAMPFHNPKADLHGQHS